MKVISLVGPSDSGKTTLVEELVPRLTDDETRVGTVKSIHHDIEIDTPGADTHRHRTAGAETVVGITPELTFEISSQGKREPPAVPDSVAERLEDDPEQQALGAALARLERRGYDIVLVEGFTAAPLPTILVGERSPADVGGSVLGHRDDGLEALVEAITSLEAWDEKGASSTSE
ncbi:molybdopterin-guanine dinucleotide biosynthesis protein B [Natronolimnobius sp. AArcel1]|uniref:molybdopterin-guanine dinucleotide biosynthesis protein B n=1 Tax=Natronolimnobius sp. AArcel1 TaxID=1679093 RepID=UPI0013E9E9B0|nr:molybdopterin-guanine dinucleotide biosynthesis protein B [Natronolimnobius sp. AArcel1]NGM70989.1 molybdopterin-guanine dinucleotide biosynthesis protein B [Natronolimnobius sp. AArcel1]